MRLIDMCTLQPNYTVYADENYKQHSSTGVHLLQENEFWQARIYLTTK